MTNIFKKLSTLFLWFVCSITLSSFLCMALFNYYASSKPAGNHIVRIPQKILIITGELSGERLALWHLEKLKAQYPNVIIHALGKDLFSTQKDIILHPEFDDIRSGFFLSSNDGLFKTLKKIPSLYQLFQKLATFIMTNNFDHIILVDLPLINLPLARKLKQKNPSIHLTLIAPPELWIWGRWSIDQLLKNNLDKIIVLYPFEKEWYHSIGLEVEWQGYPFYDEFDPWLAKNPTKKKCIALIPGSRHAELQTMLPILSAFVKKFSIKYPEVNFILPLAASFSAKFMNEMLEKHELNRKVKIISDDQEKKNALSRCFLAITKPGTITLDLALLKVPMIITYKVPLFNYLFMKTIIQTNFIGLPNLFTSREICKELLQNACTPDMLVHEAEVTYQAFLTNEKSYQEQLDALQALRQSFSYDWHAGHILPQESRLYAPQHA